MVIVDDEAKHRLVDESGEIEFLFGYGSALARWNETVAMSVDRNERVCFLDLVGADVVEVSPPYDGPGQITSLLAANLLFELLSVFALKK